MYMNFVIITLILQIHAVKIFGHLFNFRTQEHTTKNIFESLLPGHSNKNNWWRTASECKLSDKQMTKTFEKIQLPHPLLPRSTTYGFPTDTVEEFSLPKQRQNKRL